MLDLDDKGTKDNNKNKGVFIVIIMIAITIMVVTIQTSKKEVEDIKYNIEEIKKEIGKKEENVIRYRDELGIKTDSEAETLRYDYQKLNESLDDIEKELTNIKDKYKEIESSNELLTSKRARINEDIEKVKKEMEGMVVNDLIDKISDLATPELIIAEELNSLGAEMVASTNLELAPGVVKLVLVGDSNIDYSLAIVQKVVYGNLEPEYEDALKIVHKNLQIMVKDFNDGLGSNVSVVLCVTAPDGEEKIVYVTNGYDIVYDFINDIDMRAE